MYFKNFALINDESVASNLFIAFNKKLMKKEKSLWIKLQETATSGIRQINFKQK